MGNSAMKWCMEAGCARPFVARGWCRRHYKRWRRSAGAVVRRRTFGPPEERFWNWVVVTEGCWFWIGAANPKGYGRFGGGDHKTRVAHRFAYEMLVGPIPSGFTLDHLCCVRACVKPEDLEPVTHAENVRRRDMRRRLAAA